MFAWTHIAAGHKFTLFVEALTWAAPRQACHYVARINKMRGLSMFALRLAYGLTLAGGRSFS